MAESRPRLGPSVRSRQVADARGRLNKKPLPVGGAESLLALRDTYRFFSMGLVYAHDFFKEWMWADWVDALGFDPQVYYIKFNFPLFEGFEVPTSADWNSALFAVPLDLYKPLCDHLCSLAIRVRFGRDGGQHLCRYGIQSVAIADPLAIARRGFWDASIKPVSVDVIGVQTAKFQLAMRATDWRMLPRMERFEGRPQVGMVADAMDAGKNPLELVDDYDFKMAYKLTGKPREHSYEQIAEMSRTVAERVARGQ